MSIVNSTLQVLPVGSGDPGTYYVTMQPTTKGLTNAQYAGLKLTYTPLTGNLYSQIVTTNTINAIAITANTIGGNVSIGTGSLSNSVGYIGLPQNSQSSLYTLTLADQGAQIYISATANVTIPANSVIPFPIGTTINIITSPTSTSNVLINSDTLYLAGIGSTGTRTLSTYAMATLVKVTSTSWYIGGTGVS